jgi:hypothetical protein
MGLLSYKTEDKGKHATGYYFTKLNFVIHLQSYTAMIHHTFMSKLLSYYSPVADAQGYFSN